LPEWLQADLKLFVAQAHYPLAVRSSSLLEDAQFQPFAGLYKTYMLPNNHPDAALRLARLIMAIFLCPEPEKFSAKLRCQRGDDSGQAGN
jgi:hypothetical protein